MGLGFRTTWGKPSPLSAVKARTDDVSARERALFSGTTDYTGVPLEDILSHLRNWRDDTSSCVKDLQRFEGEVEVHREEFYTPDDILWYIRFFIDLLGRYVADFDRLIKEMPESVTEAHVEIVRQMHDRAVLERDRGIRFSADQVEGGVKDEAVRWLVDAIYRQSAGMIADYDDLSNIVPRLRTFVGVRSTADVELEQKFRILRSPRQEEADFERWTADGHQNPDYSIGVVFFDVDDFKSLNTRLTEETVDQDVLPPLEELIRRSTMHHGQAYGHGGDEFVIMLPNLELDEASAFAEKLRARIEAEIFTVPGEAPVTVTISAGVAAWPAHGRTLQDVRTAANNAEHQAKDGGRNRVCVAPT